MPDDVSGVPRLRSSDFHRNVRPLHDNRIHGFPLSMTSGASVLRALAPGGPCGTSVFRALAPGGPLRPVRAFCKRSLELTLQERLAAQYKPSANEPSAHAPGTACRPVRAFCKRSLALTLQERLAAQYEPSASIA